MEQNQQRIQNEASSQTSTTELRHRIASWATQGAVKGVTSWVLKMVWDHRVKILMVTRHVLGL